MAYASWVTPDKTSGSGNDTVAWTGQKNTGRNARTTTARFNASGVEQKTLTINQAGAAEFVDIADNAAVSKSGGTVTITGKSNSAKLTFSFGSNGIGLELPASYLAGGASTNNGANIAGDPGAVSEYTFSITFSGIPANVSVDDLVSQLTVTANGGQSDTCLVTQAAAAAYLTISPDTIELTAAGTAVSVTVSSNTAWDIS